MARYWVYLNDNVSGPYGLEQLIRVRGFSRQTLVCIDDSSGNPTHWISPAEIPELAHIFKAADDHLVNMPASQPPKASPKPAVPRPQRPYTPAVTLKAPSRNFLSAWPWMILAACLLAGGFFTWSRHAHQGDEAREQSDVQSLVENAHLPSPSPYSSLRQYIQDKGVKTRWEFQRMQEALYHVTLSWYAGPALAVYAFEVNTQAQTVRGLNTAAAKLLSEGFPAPASAAPKPAPAAPKKAPAELFSQAMESRREAFENGDFDSIWNLFSRRKRTEMSRGGISRDGFMRLQGLTRRVDSPAKQAVLKTKEESDTERLVLIKQSQAARPDIFIKQLWIFEDGAWKLDDEEKKTASNEDSGSRTEKSKSSESPGLRPEQSKSPDSSAKPAPATLPGMSN